PGTTVSPADPKGHRHQTFYRPCSVRHWLGIGRILPGSGPDITRTGCERHAGLRSRHVRRDVGSPAAGGSPVGSSRAADPSAGHLALLACALSETSMAHHLRRSFDGPSKS